MAHALFGLEVGVFAEQAVEVVFGGHSADVVDAQAALVGFAAPGDIDQRAFVEHRGVVVFGAKDGDGAAHFAGAHPVVDVFGAVAAGVAEGGLHAEQRAGFVLHRAVE